MQNRVRRGVTLVEVLVVVGIIGLLVGLILPAVQQVRGSADRAACADRLRQIAISLHGHHAAYGRLPPNLGGNEPYAPIPEQILSWPALILPYIDQEPLWRVSVEACKQSQYTYRSPPHIGYSTVLTAFRCPSDNRLVTPVPGSKGAAAALTSYLGVAGYAGRGGMLPGFEGVPLTAVADGTSQTMMVGERPPPDSHQSGRWYSNMWKFAPFTGPGAELSIPEQSGTFLVPECVTAKMLAYGPGRTTNPCDMYHFWSLHSGGANFAFADASVHFLTYAAAPILPAMATRAGGESVEVP